MSEQDGLVEHFVMVQDAMVAYKRRAKAAEAEVERLKGVLGGIVAHYPAGVNPYLDQLISEARKP